MTGAQLKILNTAFLSGYDMEDTLFYQLLNMVKNMLESSRDWMLLRSFDNSITFSTSDDYTGTKTLPSRFLRVYSPYDANRDEQTGVYIVDSAGNKNPLKPIKFADRFNYKDTDGYYYLDIKNNKIGRTGTLAGTLHLFFLQGTADIDSSSEWTFPSYAHPLLAVDVAIMHKGGIDWDTVNANQVPYNQKIINDIRSRLEINDSMQQQNEIGV